DPGTDVKSIIQALNEENLQLKAILITHGHFDHVSALKSLYEAFPCAIYAASDTLKVMKDPMLSLGDEDYLEDLPVHVVSESFTAAHYQIDVYQTPGHVIGSCLFHIPEENALFTGDTLFKGSIGRYDFYGSSLPDLIQSLYMIRELPFEANVYPGHGPDSTLAYEKQWNRFLHIK
ncbi:MAG: MBL fold metallo-hydrolase, partial [bacterium]